MTRTTKILHKTFLEQFAPMLTWNSIILLINAINFHHYEFLALMLYMNKTN